MTSTSPASTNPLSSADDPPTTSFTTSCPASDPPDQSRALIQTNIIATLGKPNLENSSLQKRTLPPKIRRVSSFSPLPALLRSPTSSSSNPASSSRRWNMERGQDTTVRAAAKYQPNPAKLLLVPEVHRPRGRPSLLLAPLSAHAASKDRSTPLGLARFSQLQKNNLDH